jgi:putative endonuclease
LVERLNGIQEVRGSNPLTSTNNTGLFYVYILQSASTTRFYVGHCDHLIERFHEHQAGYSKATQNRGPWRMPYYETFLARAAAQKREYALKRKKSSRYLRWLIQKAHPELELM